MFVEKSIMPTWTAGSYIHMSLHRPFVLDRPPTVNILR